jgi:hypothetical protein
MVLAYLRVSSLTFVSTYSWKMPGLFAEWSKSIVITIDEYSLSGIEMLGNMVDVLDVV